MSEDRSILCTVCYPVGRKRETGKRYTKLVGEKGRKDQSRVRYNVASRLMGCVTGINRADQLEPRL